MSMIERTPKSKVVMLSEVQLKEAEGLLLDREDFYRRFTSARNALECLYQKAAGDNMDWELAACGKFIVVTMKR